jgi:hypothetical protein
MKNPIFLFVLVFWSFTATAQNSCNCCDQPYRQFDFWVGEWVVFNSEGKKIGENVILKEEDGCLLTEDWKGEGGGTGRSMNFYDKNDATWNQVWVSNQGNTLRLKGAFKEGKMILKGPLKENDQHQKVYDQITWSPKEDGSVHQLWEVYSEEGELLKPLFLGIYRKKQKTVE